MTFSKEPSLKHTDLGSPITRFALGLMSSKDGRFHASGTAVVIGQHLAITAAHVVDDHWRKFEGERLPLAPESSQDGSFPLQAFQVLDGGGAGALWNITRIWVATFTDIAILRLTPASSECGSHKWLLPKLQAVPPKVGERLSAFGYRNPSVRDSSAGVEWNVDPQTSVGVVQEVHGRRRDACRLPFPCVQTNAPYDGGMSGGPVFTDHGTLCGIICSNMPPAAEGDEHVSYVSLLYPLMGLPITMDRAGHPPGVSYPVLDLARDGFIHCVDWEQVVLDRDAQGVVLWTGVRVAAGESPR